MVHRTCGAEAVRQECLTIEGASYSYHTREQIVRAKLGGRRWDGLNTVSEVQWHKSRIQRLGDMGLWVAVTGSIITITNDS